MTRTVKILAAIVFGFALAGASLLAADLYAHARFDDFGGLNRQGIRGPIVGAKHAGEWRVLVLGGSTAFGYGVHAGDSWPAQLSQQIHAPAIPDGHLVVGRKDIRVINLAYNAEGAFGMRATLDDYDWLEPDAIILESGYNDLGGPPLNTNIARRDSPLFRATGYHAILPLVLHEKLLSLQSGGYLDAAYRGERVIFHPTIRQQASIAGFTAADAVVSAIARTSSPAHHESSMAPVAWYLANISSCLDWAVSRHLPILIVTQPYISQTHRDQQEALAAMVERWRETWDNEHGTDRVNGRYIPSALRLGYVNLGTLINVRDTSLALDGMHLTREGNRRVAEALRPAVLDQWQEFMSR